MSQEHKTERWAEHVQCNVVGLDLYSGEYEGQSEQVKAIKIKIAWQSITLLYTMLYNFKKQECSTLKKSWTRYLNFGFSYLKNSWTKET